MRYLLATGTSRYRYLAVPGTSGTRNRYLNLAVPVPRGAVPVPVLSLPVPVPGTWYPPVASRYPPPRYRYLEVAPPVPRGSTRYLPPVPGIPVPSRYRYLAVPVPLSPPVPAVPSPPGTGTRYLGSGTYPPPPCAGKGPLRGNSTGFWRSIRKFPAQEKFSRGHFVENPQESGDL